MNTEMIRLHQSRGTYGQYPVSNTQGGCFYDNGSTRTATDRQLHEAGGGAAGHRQSHRLHLDGGGACDGRLPDHGPGPGDYKEGRRSGVPEPGRAGGGRSASGGPCGHPGRHGSGNLRQRAAAPHPSGRHGTQQRRGGKRAHCHPFGENLHGDVSDEKCLHPCQHGLSHCQAGI